MTFYAIGYALIIFYLLFLFRRHLAKARGIEQSLGLVKGRRDILLQRCLAAWWGISAAGLALVLLDRHLLQSCLFSCG